MRTFDDAFKILMNSEGGYSNNRDDPGRETMYGVTCKVARANGYKGSMVDLPLEFAKKIAKDSYWDKYKCSEFDFSIAFNIFDTAYNGGYPIKWLQLAVGVNADGIIGPATIDAVRKANASTVVAKFNAYRLQYYMSLKTWGVFGKGWTNRVANNMLLSFE